MHAQRRATKPKSLHSVKWLRWEDTQPSCNMQLPFKSPEADGGRVRRRFLRRRDPRVMDIFLPSASSPPSIPALPVSSRKSPTRHFVRFVSPLITPWRLNNASGRRRRRRGEEEKAELWAAAQRKRCRAERSEGVNLKSSRLD